MTEDKTTLHLKNIDMVLDYIKINGGQKGMCIDDIRSHFHSIFQENSKYTIAYLSTLERDGFIIQVEAKDSVPFSEKFNYMVSLEGIIFEGYYQRNINTNARNTMLEKVVSEQRSNSIFLTSLTVILTFVGLITAFYYAIEIYRFYKTP